MIGTDIPVLNDTINIMTPFLLAATGGLYSALAGVLNIALEGLMLNAAFFSIVFTMATGNIFLGILGGIVATLLMTLLFGFISLGLKANVFICGLATNLLAGALSIVLAFKIYGQTGSIAFPGMPTLSPIRIPVIHNIPVLGPLLSGYNILVYLSWLFLFLSVIIIYKTPFGIRLRAVGNDANSARSLGINPQRIKMASFLISGFTCAIGGAFLSLTLGAFVPNVTSGRGWIALAIIYLGKKTPMGVLLGAVIFGFVEYISNFLQAVSNFPAELLLSLPFFTTVGILIAFSIIEERYVKKRRPLSEAYCEEPEEPIEPQVP